MSIKYGERIVLFGAGDFGHQAARLLRFEKDILYIVDCFKQVKEEMGL